MLLIVSFKLHRILFPTADWQIRRLSFRAYEFDLLFLPRVFAFVPASFDVNAISGVCPILMALSLLSVLSR
jgi:hypothetical protein